MYVLQYVIPIVKTVFATNQIFVCVLLDTTRITKRTNVNLFVQNLVKMAPASLRTFVNVILDMNSKMIVFRPVNRSVIQSAVMEHVLDPTYVIVSKDFTMMIIHLRIYVLNVQKIVQRGFVSCLKVVIVIQDTKEWKTNFVLQFVVHSVIMVIVRVLTIVNATKDIRKAQMILVKSFAIIAIMVFVTMVNVFALKALDWMIIEHVNHIAKTNV